MLSGPFRGVKSAWPVRIQPLNCIRGRCCASEGGQGLLVPVRSAALCDEEKVTEPSVHKSNRLVRGLRSQQRKKSSQLIGGDRPAVRVPLVALVPKKKIK